MLILAAVRTPSLVVPAAKASRGPNCRGAYRQRSEKMSFRSWGWISGPEVVNQGGRWGVLGIQ
eukprot:768634-Hanusia_phi.AAC.9